MISAGAKKILMVDSDPFWQKFCQIKFRETYNMDLVGADNTAQARQRLAQFRPGVILLDIILPDQDGFGFLEELKSQPWTSDIPVVVFSSLSHRADVLHCVGLGACAYFNKKRFHHSHDLAQAIKRFI